MCSWVSIFVDEHARLTASVCAGARAFGIFERATTVTIIHRRPWERQKYVHMGVLTPPWRKNLLSLLLSLLSFFAPNPAGRWKKYTLNNRGVCYRMFPHTPTPAKMFFVGSVCTLHPSNDILSVSSYPRSPPPEII